MAWKATINTQPYQIQDQIYVLVTWNNGRDSFDETFIIAVNEGDNSTTIINNARNAITNRKTILNTIAATIVNLPNLVGTQI